MKKQDQPWTFSKVFRKFRRSHSKISGPEEFCEEDILINFEIFTKNFYVRASLLIKSILAIAPAALWNTS